MSKNNQRTRYLPVALGFLLILGSGVIQGVQSDRWGQSQKVIDAANRLSEIPGTFGEWISSDNEIPPEHLEIAEAIGSFSRTFTNRETSQTVSVMILCGRPGPISVHPPTVCFVGAGWGLQDQPTSKPLNGTVSGSLWNGRFVRNVDGVPVAIQTLWGWSGDGDWLACDNPRLETAGFPYLYKMYVTVPVSPDSGDVKSKVVQDFMDEFLPKVNHVLFEESGGHNGLSTEVTQQE